MILALETATHICSVAFCDKENSLYEKRVARRGAHSEKLFLFIEELQAEHKFSVSDLDAVLVSEGPGSYTGLRISASAIKGLLFQSEVPFYGINTLASFAMQAVEENPGAEIIHSVIDARRVHLYHQQFAFADGKLRSDDEVEAIPIKAFEKMIRKGEAVVGTGLKRIDEQILGKTEVKGPDAITAKSLIALFQAGYSDFFRQVDPEAFDPKYYTSNQVS